MKIIIIKGLDLPICLMNLELDFGENIITWEANANYAYRNFKDSKKFLFSFVLFAHTFEGKPPVLSCTFQVKRMFMYVINKRNCSHAHSMDFVNIKVMSKQFTYIKLNYPSERARHTRRIGEKLIQDY